jgi:hypothetical protein
MIYKSDGNKTYEGSWKRNLKFGEGYLIDPSKNIITKGTWRDDKIEGKTSLLKFD